MTSLSQRVLRAIPLLEKVALIVGLFFYLGYLAFIISSDRGPVDYETFMKKTPRKKFQGVFYQVSCSSE